MLVLDPSQTTFVIISSDQDFRHHYQLLSGAGFEVILVHDAKGGKWMQALEMHVGRSFLWKDIMGHREFQHDLDGRIVGEIKGSCSSSVGTEHCMADEVEEDDRGPSKGSGERGCRDINGTNSDLGWTLTGTESLAGSGALTAVKIVKGILSNSTSSDRLSDGDRPLNILSRSSTSSGNGPGYGGERGHHVHFEDSKLKTSDNEITVGNGIRGDTEIDRSYLAAVSQLSSLKMLVDEKKNKIDLFDQTVTIDAPIGASLGWMEGTCIRWKGTFGFLSVSSSGCSRPSSALSKSDGHLSKSLQSVHTVTGSIRVYAHYKSLNFVPFAMTLKRGQKVKVLVEMGDRGPCAKKVESV